MPIGDRLAPARQIRLHTQDLPTRAASQTESGAHVVENQHGTAVVACRAHAPGELLLYRSLILEGVMTIWRHHDRRKVAACGLHRCLEARYVIVGAKELVGPILRERALQIGGTPRGRAMIGARAADQPAAPRV